MLTTSTTAATQPAIEGDYVYWLDRHGGQRRVKRTSIYGGQPIETVVENTEVPSWFVVDSASVFFSDETTFKSVPVAGGLVQLLATDPCAGLLVQDGTHLSWVPDALVPFRIHRVSKGGGAVEEVLSQPMGGLIATGGGWLFLVPGGEVYRMPPDGGAPPEHFMGSNVSQIAVNSMAVYVVGSIQNTIGYKEHTWEPAGGGQTFVSSTAGTLIHKMVATEQYVVWIDNYNDRVARKLVSGGAIEYHALVGNPTDLGAQGDLVAWVEDEVHIWVSP
jgi:hypothetical protein